MRNELPRLDREFEPFRRLFPPPEHGARHGPLIKRLLHFDEGEGLEVVANVHGEAAEADFQHRVGVLAKAWPMNVGELGREIGLLWLS